MRSWKVAVVFVAVVALVAGVPSAASATVTAPAAAAVSPLARFAAPPPDFTPSPNKWRKWMVTQVSSVLGNLTPKSWRAENIANQFGMSHSW